MAGSIRLDPNNWYRLEGCILPTNEYNYSSSNISILKEYDIWYTNVEIRLQNPSSTHYIHGVNYKTRTFAEYGFKTIDEIADNFNTVYSQMLNDMIENHGALTYTEPFVITESSVICYNDAYDSGLTKVIVILKDDYLNPDLTGITAVYDGPTVSMDEEFEDTYLTVTGTFSDGHTSKLMPDTFTVIRKSDNIESKVINAIGTNQFTAIVKYGDNTFQADFGVIGIKRLVGVSAIYDGPNVALDKEALKRNFVVCAEYSDGSTSTVTDWSFLNGNKITNQNKGILTIYYLGFTYDVIVPYYETDPSQLKAFYNGPDIEKGKTFLLEHLTVKIYYKNKSNTAGGSYWETLEQEDYTVDTQYIALEGDNIITVTYKTNNGTVLTTTFIVKGFIAKAYIGYITAEYSGPPIQVDKYYNTNKVTVKAYWSNGDVSIIKNFNVDKTKVTQIGDNKFTAIYKENTCEFIVIGLTAESTNETNYTPTQIDLKYPEGNKLNHRYRGPMESLKFDEYNKFVYENINNLFNIYNSLKKTYNNISVNNESLFNTSTKVLGTVSIIEDKVSYIKNLKKGEL
jgi:hypothetical protein